MAKKVFEGQTALDIKPFLDGLKKLEESTEGSAANIAKTFKSLDASIGAALSGLKATLSSISGEVAAVQQTIAQANRALAQGQQQISQLAGQAKQQQAISKQSADQRRAAAQAERLDSERDLAALRSRLAQETRLRQNAANQMIADFKRASAAEREALVKKLRDEATATEAAIQQQRAARQKALQEAVQQQRAAAGQQSGVSSSADTYRKALQAAESAKLKEMALERQLRIVTATERKAALQVVVETERAKQQAAQGTKAMQTAEARASQSAARAGLDALRSRLDEETRLYATMQRQRVDLQRNSILQIQLSEREYFQGEQRRIEAQIQKEQELRQKAVRLMEAADRARAGKSAPAAAVALSDEGYRKLQQAAERTQERERALRRQLTVAAAAEATAFSRAVGKGYDQVRADAEKLAKNGAFGFVETLKIALVSNLENARQKLKEVEDQFNSIYRAGSQLTQLGSMMTTFASNMLRTLQGLTQGANEFDFSMRRAVAATEAANTQMGVSIDKTIVNVDRFREAALQIGRGVGILDPNEIANSWFVYQSALGGAITTTEDIAQAQKNVDLLLKASIVTNTAYDTTIRGATASLAQFGLTAEDLEYGLSVMANVTQTTQAEFSNVLETFKMVGPQAHRLGLDIADVGTAISVLADNNVRGSQAGRLLASGLTNLVRPTKQINGALQDLFVSSRGLTGEWTQFLYKNGEFVGLFDQINEKGEAVTKGFLRQFAEATKGMSNAQREFYIASIFGKESSKVFGTLIAEYAESMGEGGKATEGLNNRVNALNAAMRDQNGQIAAFGNQWETVAEGTKVKMAQLSFTFSEVRTELGVLVARALIPFLELAAKGAEKVLAWAKANPELVTRLVQVAAAVGAVAAVLGTLITGVGIVLQGLAGFKIALATLGIAGSSFTSIAGSLVGAFFRLRTVALLFNPAALAIVGVLYLLRDAWKNNFGEMQATLERVVASARGLLGALGDVIGGIKDAITGLFSGNSRLIETGLRNIAVGLVEAFYVIPSRIAAVLGDIGNKISTWAANTFNRLTGNMNVWGRNVIISLSNGMISALSYVFQAAYAAAEGIARYFRSYSPPKYGPLRQIQEWGKNLITTLFHGMSSADFAAVNEIADRIGVALKRNIEDGIASPSTYAATAGAANNLVDDMLQVVRNGGRVNDDFFSSLRNGLGEWYQYISDIALAYQDVYANERQLKIEQEKLAVLKAQREELQRQANARSSLFDKALGGTDGAGAQANADAMVDPLTPEGQRKIEEMRSKLSREDFQNWLGFQKKLWGDRASMEDKTLQQTEETQQTQVDTLSKQLEAANKQYETYVAMYEYAVKMYELAKEQQQLEQQKTAGGAAGADGTQGDPEALKAFLGEIARLIGQDSALLDEQTLKNNRGGDDIGALGDATRQKERENERLSELEKLNRRKRSEFEVALVNASTEEERKRIKAQADAWDAAYKQEKARLQERASLAQEIQDAAEKQADASLAGRIGDTELGYQQEIKNLLGEQTAAIEDANKLKAESGSLDEAQVKARSQMRDEERKLRDLQAANDQKKIEFEQRLREAANDPEKMRRIKEEQEAWDSAYKKALEAQQLRVELARRAQQDLGDETQGLGAAGAGGGALGGRYPQPDFGVPDPYAEDPNDPRLRKPQPVKPQRRPNVLDESDNPQPKPPRDSEMEAFLKWYELQKKLNRELDNFNTGLGAVGQALNDFWRWLGGGQDPLEAIWKGFQDWWQSLTGGRDLLADFLAGLSNFWESITTGNGFLKTWWEFMGYLWEVITRVWSFIQGEGVKGLQAWLDVMKKLYDEGVSTLAYVFRDILLPILYVVWDFFKVAMLPILNLVAVVAKEGLKLAIEALAWAWEKILQPAIQAVWDVLTKNLLPLLLLLKDVVLVGLEIAVKGLAQVWETILKPAIKAFYDYAEKYLMPFLRRLWDFLKESLTPGVDAVGKAFDLVWEAISKSITKVGEWIDKARDAIQTFREWLGLSGQKPPETSNPDGYGKGGSSGGKGYAGGLYAVPRDMFAAYLHKGERVLTAQEASVYNALEAAVKGTSAAVGRATTAMHNATVNSGGNRTVNISIGSVNSSSPESGRALVSQLAFLSS